VGHPPLPTRLMAGLAILKSLHDLSDGDLCARWIENPYFQMFCDGIDGVDDARTGIWLKGEPCQDGCR
jgi:hypothetical protein